MTFVADLGLDAGRAENHSARSAERQQNTFSQGVGKRQCFIYESQPSWQFTCFLEVFLGPPLALDIAARVTKAGVAWNFLRF